jgi:hypothetical protein
MSQESVETVRRMTEALDRANWDGVFAEISPDGRRSHSNPKLG